MNSFRLSWAVLGPDHSIENSRRGSKDGATLEDTLQCLDEVLGGAGLVELVVVDPADVGPRGMQLRTDGGRSILTLAEVDAKREKNIRLFRAGEDGDDVEILGAPWKRQFVCRDDAVIKSAFTELLATGEVSSDLLS